MAIRQKTTVTLKAEAHCPSHSLANVRVRDLEFAIDEPTERGGTNTGPTPTDTAIAALVGCTNVIAHKCADKLGIELGHLDIQAECQFDRRGVTLAEEVDVPFVALNLIITANGSASVQQLEQVKNEVAKYCPLSRLFRQAGTNITETWQVA